MCLGSNNKIISDLYLYCVYIYIFFFYTFLIVSGVNVLKGQACAV